MQLGISSYTYTWAIGVPGSLPERPLDAVGLLRKAVALGVGLVQIADNLPLHQLLPAELERLERAAHDLNVAIEVGTRGIAPGHLFAYLDLALRLGSPLVRVVVDTVERQPTESEIVDTLRSLMPAFERARVILAIENHDFILLFALIVLDLSHRYDCTGFHPDHSPHVFRPRTFNPTGVVSTDFTSRPVVNPLTLG